MLTEARDLGEELATPRSAPRRCPGACRRSSRSPTSSRRGARCRAPGDRRADRAAVHAPRRRALRLGDRARDGRLDEAEALAQRSHDGAGCSPGATPRASTGSRCSASAASRGAWRSSPRSIRVLARRRAGAGALAPGLVALLAELGMEAEARAELSRIAADGLDAFASRSGSASLTYLTDACAALGDEQSGRARLPRARAARGRRT